jgi:hypothetical protein
VTHFNLGPLSIDAVEFASQGNAILGIRDSGKTYTATALAERLFDAGIPFFAFDPIGVWRYLRVPGHGRGYPVVVAGGKAPDLPLTVEGTPELVRAAMKAGVSLVFDLFDLHMSKGDWRKIVTQAVRVMLHENHDLRHIFIEEAAEFIPQKPNDWIVYAEIEKLARMGRNSRLGYTLINQRSQEVSKAILELCENVFLHRQRGSHAIQALDKWLQVAEATERRKIIKSLPDLPRGQCWAWLGGDTPLPPTLVTVPEKNSLHPDARRLRGAVAAMPAKPVDVAEFVARMQGRLVAPAPAIPKSKPKEPEVTKEEADRLRAKNEQLEREIEQLRASLARAVDRAGTVTDSSPTPKAIPNVDYEALYQEIKGRLINDAPALLRVLAVKPEIEVTVERKTINLDETKPIGRVAKLIAEGFFDSPISPNAAHVELQRLGKGTSKPNVYKICDDLAAMGFLTKEASGYQAVPGMKINII